MRYRKKPVEIQAVEWDGKDETVDQVVDLAKSDREISHSGPYLYIKTLEGEMAANIGDFIIQGVSGEVYPCKPDIFWKTYEPV